MTTIPATPQAEPDDVDQVTQEIGDTLGPAGHTSDALLAPNSDVKPRECLLTVPAVDNATETKVGRGSREELGLAHDLAAEHAVDVDACELARGDVTRRPGPTYRRP